MAGGDREPPKDGSWWRGQRGGPPPAAKRRQGEGDREPPKGGSWWRGQQGVFRQAPHSGLGHSFASALKREGGVRRLFRQLGGLAPATGSSVLSALGA